MRQIYLAAIALASSVLICGSVMAQSLQMPSSDPILVVAGKIENTNVSGMAEFDMPMLEALGMVTIKTKTPWFDGVVSFEGVPMDRLMKVVGAKGDTVRAIALNDYAITIPMADFAKYGTMLAIKRDGQYMPVRDKGPLFIVYPFDSRSELQTQTYYGRSAWQLAKLIVE